MSSKSFGIYQVLEKDWNWQAISTPVETFLDVPWHLTIKNSNDKSNLMVNLHCDENSLSSSTWRIDSLVKIEIFHKMGSAKIPGTTHVFQQDATELEVSTLKKEEVEAMLECNESIFVKCTVRINNSVGISRIPFDEFEEKDFAIVVRKQKRYVSKATLAFSSPIFQTMLFGAPYKGNELFLRNVSIRAVGDLVAMISHVDREVNLATIGDLTQLAVQYEIPMITEKCSEFLKNCSTNDVRLCVRIAEKYNMEDVLRTILSKCTVTDLNQMVGGNYNKKTLEAIVARYANRAIDNGEPI